MLQRSAAPRNVDMMDVSDDTLTPSPKENSTPRASPPALKTELPATSNIDPLLSGMSSPGERSESDDSARDRAEEAWIENIRVIEALRKMVQDRLERKEYADDNEDVAMSGTGAETKAEKTSENLYPVLRADDD
jgi:hypothetical protein